MVSPVEKLPTLDAALAWFVDRGLIHHEGADAVARARPPPIRAARPARPRARPRPSGRRCARSPTRSPSTRAPRGRARRPSTGRSTPARSSSSSPAPDGVSVDHRHVGDPIDDALARLAEPLVTRADRAATRSGSGSAPTTPASGSSTTARARPDAAGATWRPVATGPRRRATAPKMLGPGSETQLAGPLEDRPDLGREARHRFLVVGRREARDEVAVADVEVGQRAARRRPPACRPAGPSTGRRCRCARSIAFWTRSASARESRMITVADARSSARSRPGPARRSRSARARIASLRLTFSSPPPTLFASAYCATSLSVTCSPPPPTSSGSRSWIGGGSLRTAFAA